MGNEELIRHNSEKLCELMKQLTHLKRESGPCVLLEGLRQQGVGDPGEAGTGTVARRKLRHGEIKLPQSSRLL